MAGVLRTVKLAMLACVAAGAALSLWVRERPGVAVACLGALASSRALPALARRRGLELSAPLEVLFLAPFVACWGFGEGLGLFERLGWWDCLTHALGGAAMFGLWWAWGAQRLRAGEITQALLGAALALAAGALWEIGEYASDSLLGTFTQAGNDDTMRDLIFDLAGGLLGAWAIAFASLVRHASVQAVVARLHGEKRRV